MKDRNGATAPFFNEINTSCNRLQSRRACAGNTLTIVRGAAVDLAEAGGYILVGGTAEPDPAKVTAYSEKDVMTVPAMVREEFNIDNYRIYLMGHSQGGGRTPHCREVCGHLGRRLAALDGIVEY